MAMQVIQRSERAAAVKAAQELKLNLLGSKARRIRPLIRFNGVDVTDTVSGCLEDMSYTDPATGTSDSIELTFSDRDGKWQREWFPKQGDILYAEAVYEDWEVGRDDLTFRMGRFVLDSFGFSGNGCSVQLSGVSAPVDKDFKATERTKTWENVTVQQIAADIAGRAGIQLYYDAGEVKIELMEQDSETDSSFLTALCEDYGLSIKVYNERLVIFDREAYKQKKPVRTITAEEIQSWDWETDMQGSYTGAKISWQMVGVTDVLEYETGTKERVLSVSGKASSKADAEKRCRAALAAANHSMTKMSITILGNGMLSAGQVVTVDMGESRISGDYYIDSIAHEFTGGYSEKLELAKIRDKEGQDGV